MKIMKSKLTDIECLSPMHSGKRTDGVSKITIHHMAANLTVEQCGKVFKTKEASTNYGIGSDGRVALYVDEENRSWASANEWNDNRAITIEVANDVVGGNWHVSDIAYDKLIELCADICTRYNITPSYDGTKNGSFTEHRMFMATACPGEYLHSKMSQIVEDVKARMNSGTNVPTKNQESEEHCTVNLPILRNGSKGKSVTALQRMLFCYFSCPLDLEIDGVFGTITQKYVEKFQAFNSIDIDGIVGTDTWTKLLKG